MGLPHLRASGAVDSVKRGSPADTVCCHAEDPAGNDTEKPGQSAALPAASKHNTPLPSALSSSTFALRPPVGEDLRQELSKSKDEPASSAYIAWKPLLDRTIALLLLIITSPVIIVLALLVKLTSLGPAFYSQKRLGEGGEEYTILKLRTMRHNAEAFSGPTWAIPRDPRTTDIGRFLRITHLDELPQLYNVLRGDMSLVGPRPERPEIVAFLREKVPGYVERLQVKPGITGLAQIRLPPDSLNDLEGVRRKLQCDMYYIKHRGLWLDIRLMFCTGMLMFGIPLRLSRNFFFLPNPLKEQTRK